MGTIEDVVLIATFFILSFHRVPDDCAEFPTLEVAVPLTEVNANRIAVKKFPSYAEGSLFTNMILCKILVWRSAFGQGAD